MADPPRVTGPVLDVLESLVDAFDAGQDLPGWAIVKATKRSGPTVYGVLDQLEDLKWITGRWAEAPERPGKARRRLYALTPTGQAQALALLRERFAQRRAAARGVGPARPGLLGGGAV